MSGYHQHPGSLAPHDWSFYAFIELALSPTEAAAMRHCVWRYRWQNLQDALRRQAAELRNRQ